MQLADVLRVLKEHDAELRSLRIGSLAVFGSFARGEPRDDSDVDLLVEFDRPVGLFHFVRVRRRLAEILGRRVDLATPGSLHPALRERILNEAIRAA